MNLKLIFTTFLLLSNFLVFSQKQRIKSTNLFIIPPDNTWTSSKRSLGISNEDGIKITVGTVEKNSYASLQQFKRDYSDLYKMLYSNQITLPNGVKAFIFKGNNRDEEIVFEMYVEFSKEAKSFNCKYPIYYDKELSNKIIKSLSTVEIDEKIDIDLSENIEYQVSWKELGFKINNITYSFYDEKAANLALITDENNMDVDLGDKEITVDIQELISSDIDSNLDSLSRIENKKIFSETLVSNTNEYQIEGRKIIHSKPMTLSESLISYRVILEVPRQERKVNHIYQFIWVNDRIFLFTAKTFDLNLNLPKFEILLNSFKLV